MPSSILSSLTGGVEKPLVFFAVVLVTVSVCFKAGAFGAVQPAPVATNADQELQPLPEPNTLGDSDYAEARAFIKKKKWAEAVVVLRSLLRHSPGNTPASIDLATVLVYLGRTEEALSTLSSVISKEPTDLRERVIQRLKVVSKLFLTKETFQIFQDGVNLLRTQKYHAARERFEKALEVEPGNVEILTRLAQCQVLDGDADSATEKLRLATRLNPYEPEIKLWLGRALHQRGDLTTAIEELREVQSSLDASELAPLWLAEAYSSAGQKALAIQVLIDDTKVQPLHLMSLLSLAKFQMQGSSREVQNLWEARKNLQLAMSRLADYTSSPDPQQESDLGLPLRKSAPDLTAEITKQLALVQSRLDEGADQKLAPYKSNPKKTAPSGSPAG
jgi:tetratricopeptide (TPR) repeat protein